MKPNKLVAIHQPNFFPWFGYFHKVAKADIFVFMDNAQMSKKGGTWENRVKLLVGGKARLVTVPIVRTYHGVRATREIGLNETIPWRRKLLRTVEVNYGRAPFFSSVFPSFIELVSHKTSNLCDFNLNAIRTLSTLLDIDTSKLVRGSEIEVNGVGTDLLISMVKAVGGNAYFCGGGASGYQEDEKFLAASVELLYQNFKHPTYRQFNSQQFVSGLSIIDALMNCGFEGTRDLLATD